MTPAEITALISAILLGLAGLLNSIGTARGAAKKADVESLKEAVDNLTSENERLRKLLTTTEEENNRMHEQDVVLRQKVAEQEIKIESLQAQLDALSCQYEELKRENEALKEQLAKQTSSRETTAPKG